MDMTAAGPPLVPAAAERALPIMPLDQGAPDPSGTREFHLRAQAGTSRFFDGIETRTLGYNAALLGPALRLRAGEATRIHVRNDLDEPTTVHWHGLVVAAEVDGGPHQPIVAGAQWTASFSVSNPPSTCWFHPHIHGSTGRQVAAGLAGLLIVDDPTINQGLLPHTWGIDDLAVVLQDKRFDAAGQIDYALTANDRVAGYSGDTLLANGVAGAVWAAPRQWVRLRLVNGCNARVLSLRLDRSAALLQVANEGGLLAAPLLRPSIVLAPGERAEALVDLSGVPPGADMLLLARGIDTGMGMGMGMGMRGAAQSGEVPALKMRVSLPSQANAIATAPSRLEVSPAVTLPVGAMTRSFSLDGGMMGSRFTINGRTFEIDRVDLRIPAGTVEVWRFFNGTMMAHPMHVHGVRMSLLARDGAPPAAHERGLRDTFVVEPMQTVSVAVAVAAQPSSTPLVFHCHILEHEDAGMMGQFITVQSR